MFVIGANVEKLPYCTSASFFLVRIVSWKFGIFFQYCFMQATNHFCFGLVSRTSEEKTSLACIHTNFA